MVENFWHVRISEKADKSLAKLPKLVLTSLASLLTQIEAEGPVRGDWPNYGKLSPNRHHCH